MSIDNQSTRVFFQKKIIITPTQISDAVRSAREVERPVKQIWASAASSGLGLHGSSTRRSQHDVD